MASAVDPTKLGLGILALLGLWLGYLGLDALFPSASPLAPTCFRELPRMDEASLANPVVVGGKAVKVLAQPARALTGPAGSLFRRDAKGQYLRNGMAALLGLAVWGLAGTAIARMALVGITNPTGRGVGPIRALRFAWRRSGALATATLVPLVAVGSVTMFTMLFGLLYRVPGQVGAILAGSLAFLPLIGGLAIAVFLTGLAVAWPLMVASVAAEGEDGYDAFSRAFGYVTQRPLRYFSYVAIAVALGLPAVLAASALAEATFQMADWGLALSAPQEIVGPLVNPDAPEGVPPTTAANLHAFWRGAVNVAALAFVYVYFWTSMSAIYLLIRRDVDGAEWDDIDLSGNWDHEKAGAQGSDNGILAPPVPTPAEKPAPAAALRT
jgi:hypothetical protein